MAENTSEIVRRQKDRHPTIKSSRTWRAKSGKFDIPPNLRWVVRLGWDTTSSSAAERALHALKRAKSARSCFVCCILRSGMLLDDLWRFVETIHGTKRRKEKLVALDHGSCFEHLDPQCFSTKEKLGAALKSVRLSKGGTVRLQASLSAACTCLLASLSSLPGETYFHIAHESLELEGDDLPIHGTGNVCFKLNMG